MKENKLLVILEDIGLSENEAKIYLASLSLGPSTVLKLSRAGDIKRTTVYTILESLRQKGLMSVEPKGFKQLYAAENPEKLEAMLEIRKERFKKSLPEFLALHSLKGEQGLIKYFTGLEAVKSVYEEVLKDVEPNDDYLVLSNHEQWMSLDPDFFQDFKLRRAKLSIRIRMILQDNESGREAKQFAQNYNTEVKLLPAETKLTTNLICIPQRVVIHQLVPPVSAIVIENKSVVEMHREMFEIMWKAL